MGFDGECGMVRVSGDVSTGAMCGCLFGSGPTCGFEVMALEMQLDRGSLICGGKSPGGLRERENVCMWENRLMVNRVF